MSYLIGLVVLLFASISLFDGPLAAAVWQLTGVLWMGFNFWRLDKYGS